MAQVPPPPTNADDMRSEIPDLFCGVQIRRIPPTRSLLRYSNQSFGVDATEDSRTFPNSGFETFTNFTQSQNWQVEFPGKKGSTGWPRKNAFAWQVRAANCASGPFIA